MHPFKCQGLYVNDQKYKGFSAFSPYSYPSKFSNGTKPKDKIERKKKMRLTLVCLIYPLKLCSREMLILLMS